MNIIHTIANFVQRKLAAARRQFQAPEPDVLAAAVTAGVVSRSVVLTTLGASLAVAGLWYGAVLCALFVLLDMWTGFHVLRTIVDAVRNVINRAFLGGLATPSGLFAVSDEALAT